MFLCQLYYPFETLRAPVLPKNIKPITLPRSIRLRLCTKNLFMV